MTALHVVPLTEFEPPGPATAAGPPEARGLARDAVRLLVVSPAGVTHAQFSDLADHLDPGDVVVVNNSTTLPGELDGTAERLGPVVVHAAGELDDGSWVVELRTAPDAERSVLDARPGDVVRMPGLTTLELRAAYPHEGSSPTGRGNRLWRATVAGPRPFERLLARHGRPIAYGYLDRRYPLEAYQTVFATEPGSAEMPSAARPFSTALVTRLVSRGIGVVAVTLHTGVSSQEAGEAPQPERYAVSAAAADAVNAARARGSRVVAVGTTATRALESAAGPDGVVGPSAGWTERVVSREEPARVVTALVTGWHDPQASHLLLVESVAGPELTQAAYDAATAGGYLWHEFGDSSLLLP